MYAWLSSRLWCWKVVSLWILRSIPLELFLLFSKSPCLPTCLPSFFSFFFFSNFFIRKSLPVYERSVFFQLRSKPFGFVLSQTDKEVQRERGRELAGGGEGSCSILFLFAVLYSCLLLGNFLVETVCLMLVEIEMLNFVLIVSFRHVWICKILQ